MQHNYGFKKILLIQVKFKFLKKRHFKNSQKILKYTLYSTKLIV